MKKILQTKWKSILLSALLVVCLTGACVLGISLAQRASAEPEILISQSWGDLAAALPDYTTNYYKLAVKNTGGQFDNKIIMAVKKRDNVEVYSQNDEGVFSDSPDSNYKVDAVYANGTESWTVSRVEDNEPFFTNQVSKVVSVSPLSTPVKAIKLWNGQNGIDYLNVSDGTEVKFVLKAGDEEIRDFRVKKAGEKLQVSLDGSTYYDNNVALEDGKTLNACLVPASGSFSEEKWIITFTGFDKFDLTGALTEYTVEERNIKCTGQAWSLKSTRMVSTFDGVQQYQAYDTVYTLVLKDDEGRKYDILKFRKTVYNDDVSRVEVEGISEPWGGATFATIVSAACEERTMYAENSKLVFEKLGNNDSPAPDSIYLEDMVSAQGVTVRFNIGIDNGPATLTLKMTPSGKLSYDFEGLPAENFSPDPEGDTTIPVDSYRVEVVKVYSN